MTLSLTSMGIYFQLLKAHHIYIESLSFLPVLSLGIFIFFFSIGIGPIAFVFQGELFSSQAKAFAAPIGQFLNFVLFFVIVIVFGELKDSIGDGPTFFMFAAFSAALILFTVIFVKETKGKSLIQIQEMLRK